MVANVAADRNARMVGKQSAVIEQKLLIADLNVDGAETAEVGAHR
jgi:hypothetical protein